MDIFVDILFYFIFEDTVNSCVPMISLFVCLSLICRKNVDLCKWTVSCPVAELVCHFLDMTEMEQNQVDGRDWVTVKGVCSDPVVCG